MFNQIDRTYIQSNKSVIAEQFRRINNICREYLDEKDIIAAFFQSLIKSRLPNFRPISG